MGKADLNRFLPPVYEGTTVQFAHTKIPKGDKLHLESMTKHCKVILIEDNACKDFRVLLEVQIFQGFNIAARSLSGGASNSNFFFYSISWKIAIARSDRSKSSMKSSFKVSEFVRMS